jgi:membrane protease YdiL (CAAX protease family)
LSSPDNPQFAPPAPLAIETPEPVTPHTPPVGADPYGQSPLVLAPIPVTPPCDPVWTGWDVLLIAVLTLVTMVVLQLGVAVLAQHLWYPRLTLGDVIQKPILLIGSQLLLYAAAAAGMIMLIEGKYQVRFWQALHWNWPKSAWPWLGVGAVTLFGLVTLEAYLPRPKDTPFEHLFDSPLDGYLLSLIAVTFAPLLEEVFFRGLLYPVLARRMGVAWGILLTALPFGLIHLQQYGWAWSAALIIFLVGVVCGVVRARVNSVGASFLVHASYNGVQTLFAIVATHGFRHLEKGVFMFR